ncbi:MAG: hypothetical protein JOZ56_05655 [Actinobacteria bacterium]|nr:hypothetical protein [Actinomycetota bacterium]
MRDERGRDRLVPGGRPRDRVELGGGAVEAQRLTRAVEVARAEQRRGGGPERAVAVRALGAELAAERDQLREVADRVDVPEARDVDEAVRVEVVAEQQSRVRVGGREQPRP